MGDGPLDYFAPTLFMTSSSCSWLCSWMRLQFALAAGGFDTPPPTAPEPAQGTLYTTRCFACSNLPKAQGTGTPAGVSTGRSAAGTDTAFTKASVLGLLPQQRTPFEPALMISSFLPMDADCSALAMMNQRDSAGTPLPHSTWSSPNTTSPHPKKLEPSAIIRSCILKLPCIVHQLQHHRSVVPRARRPLHQPVWQRPDAQAAVKASAEQQTGPDAGAQRAHIVLLRQR